LEPYLINDLERLSGIKAHTIRIWEKRYGLIIPERSATNRRCYNDEQLRKLLNVSTLLSHGLKISLIAAFSESQINDYVQSITNNGSQGDIVTGYVNGLIKAMLSYDEEGFDKIFSASVLRYGFYKAMLTVIYPFLIKAGVLWSTDKTAPAQEHFASWIVRKKLMAATDSLLQPPGNSRKYLLLLPKGEWHEIGLLFANYILRYNGCKTIYLGQNVPNDNIRQVIEDTDPQYLLMFYIVTRPKEEVERQVSEIAKRHSYLQILVAGNPELFPEKKTRLKQVTYLTEVNDLQNTLQ